MSHLYFLVLVKTKVQKLQLLLVNMIRTKIDRRLEEMVVDGMEIGGAGY